MFELAGGTVAGRDHRERGANNHDAYYSFQTPDCTIAIICDGCGSEYHSEVGAKLCARLVAETIRRYVHELNQSGGSTFPFPYWERVRQDVLASLRVMINSMSSTISGYRPGSFSQTVYDHFLFTTVGVLSTPQGSSFFS